MAALDQLRVVVAEREHAGAGQEIDEHVAIDIPDKATVRLGDGDRQMARVRAGIRLPVCLACKQFGGSRTGHRTRYDGPVKSTSSVWNGIGISDHNGCFLGKDDVVFGLLQPR